MKALWNYDEGYDDDTGEYLDFQKAFDKVPHQRLLSKLEALGITGKFSGWINFCVLVKW